MKVIAIDMDDTLCHFRNAHKRAIQQNPGILYPQCEYGFFRNLEPLRGAVSAVHTLSLYFHVHILTRPSIDNPLCWTEKAEWVKWHLGTQALKNTTMTSHKDRFIADYLIDDVTWPGFTGEQILFGQEHFDTWAKVINYILTKEGLIN